MADISQFAVTVDKMLFIFVINCLRDHNLTPDRCIKDIIGEIRVLLLARELQVAAATYIHSDKVIGRRICLQIGQPEWNLSGNIQKDGL